MKKFLKGVVVGSLITGIIMSSSLAFGEATARKITAYFNDIKIYVDGVKINGADAKGNKVEPFIYNGTVYLPVRAVSDAIGKDVTWDSNTYTVYLGEAKQDTVGLSDLKPYEIENLLGNFFDEDSDHYSRREITMQQKSYPSVDQLHTGTKHYYDYSDYINEASDIDPCANGYVSYILDGKYSEFEAVVGRDDSCLDQNLLYPEGSIKIYCDDKLVFSNKSIEVGEEPIKIGGSTLGVNKIEIYMKGERVVLTNAKFHTVK